MTLLRILQLPLTCENALTASDLAASWTLLKPGISSFSCHIPSDTKPPYLFTGTCTSSPKRKGIENYIQTHHPLPSHFDFFRVRPDVTVLPGFSVIIKCTCAIRQLAYGVTLDSIDEYLQIALIVCTGNEEIAQKHGMANLLDVIKTGANNDLTVLSNSSLFDDLLDDIAPVAPFERNGLHLKKEKNALFKQKQESARKDVERAFGVLQGRWHIICQLARAWTVNKLRRVMYTCIILHNMILKDQKFALSEFDQQNYICPQANILWTWVERCEFQRKKSKELRDKQTHAKLQRNVIEHLWQQHLQHQHED
nr:hypothetical protein [Tanacetum cinerariifolium]